MWSSRQRAAAHEGADAEGRVARICAILSHPLSAVPAFLLTVVAVACSEALPSVRGLWVGAGGESGVLLGGETGRRERERRREGMVPQILPHGGASSA